MINKRTPIKSIPCDKKALGITRGKVIYLRREGSKSGGEYFKINGIVGEGGSCVCYDATSIGEKKTGRLKEFYPTECIKRGESFTLERSERNHIIATEETRSSFASALEEFTKSYHLLRDVIEKNKNNSDFTSFIPDFSIYYAADENGDYIEGSTAYIWTAPQNLTVFEKYIDDIRKHPGVYPEHKLFTVLKTVLTLTECVKTLHENGLLHLDIKPGNFGIPKRKGKLLTDSITLFDVNTIYSLNGSVITEYGTEGFSAPEMLNRGANNTSDIYSIGCTLFSALIANDEIPTQGYSKKYYTRIEELIDTSKLITASETNSNLFLKHELVSILKKCLAESKGKRYQSCVDLIKDLERALAYLYPAEINARLPIGKQLVVLEKELDKKQGVSSYLRFLYHLYKKPLFEFLTNYSETVDVLIVGFGNYGQKFLDCCLQVGQILGKKLNVKVVSNDRAEGKRDKDIYLAARPELSKFFSIDGNEVYDSYGSIVFENREFTRDSLKKNKEIALEIASECNMAKYVFVALGNDSLNRSVARAILSVSEGENRCSVNFAYDGERISGKVYGNPIYMHEDVSAEPLYQDIERMAFNAHLVWEAGPNIDLVKARAKFKEPYNYNASFSYVIAIKYKLYSFGIPMDDTSEAATKYYRKILKQSDKTKHELAALEHRRWVCEKLVLGWTCNSDLESCLKVKPNDKKAKKHVCLVRSRPDSTLNTARWTPERWDNATKAELEALDDLDRMSVKLHKVYKKAADQMKRESALLDSSMLQLRSISLKDPKASIAFSEWYSCLSLIWDGNDSPVTEYEKLKNMLIESLSELKLEDQNTAKVLIKLIDGRFDVILKSMQYTDYKNYDCDFIQYIPYILTHKKDTHLVIPFSCGGNTQMFANVASATVANPSQITYLIHVVKMRDIDSCRRALAYVFNYLSEKLLRPKLNFIMTYIGDAKIREAVEELKAEITDGKAYSRVQRVILEEIEKDSCVSDSYLQILSDPRFIFDAIEVNETNLSSNLVGAKFYEKFPNYQFDMNTLRFHSCSGCDFLKFVKANHYLKISDMFAAKNSKGYLDSPAAFYNDYEALWNKAYRRKEFLWKKMCNLLSGYHKEADKIVTINTFEVTKDKGSVVKYRFLVPSAAYEGAKKIIDAMVEADAFEKNSEVFYYTTDSCEVNIYASSSIESRVKTLFADPNILCQPDSIEIVTTPYSVCVNFDRLVVENINLDNLGKHAERIRDILRMLEKDFAFITAYTESGDNGQLVSFTYATRRIKKLMVNAGNILEIYVYHKCLNSGLFDDIATSYEISWDGTQVKSEFDILITKGFAGLFIEAKATEDISQDYYFKLSSLARQFGTNCLPILIADTVERPDNDNSNNDNQRLRGDMLDVITISDPAEIDSIDRTLARILNVDIKSESDEKAENQGGQANAKKPAAPKPAEQKPAAPQPLVPNPVVQDFENMTREEFLAKRVATLRFVEQSLASILNNNGVCTVADVLAQTEESFAALKSKKNISYTSRCLQIQESIKKILASLK